MNQRRLPDDSKIIPEPAVQQLPENVSEAEKVVFDKAEKAEQIEKEKQKLLDTIQECKDAMEEVPESEKQQLKDSIRECQERLKEFENSDPG
jgi:mevalonate kinase